MFSGYISSNMGTGSPSLCRQSNVKGTQAWLNTYKAPYFDLYWLFAGKRIKDLKHRFENGNL